ncbi:MAG: SDR family oxidoreductase [Kiritimatiellales bacterium]|nr:SDR family oxidoreductase [Kiritimatiellales bacterium]MCF7863462.1 SDR family oxidoreductase [Kiritimatiellales bacterium]
MNRTALVTGGAHGIGRTIAELLLRDGWNVAVLDVAEPETSFDNRVLFIRGDVGNETDVESAIQQTLDLFGGLHGLVNNAGIGINRPLEQLVLEDWDRVVSTNLTGTFLCAKHAAAHLRQTRGAMVNIASTRARQSEANTEAYSASKGGIVALTHAMAVSLGPEIRVNCVSPGWIDTRPAAEELQSEADRQQHPCGRVGEPADIAELVSFLLSDRAGFITGQDFVVDGGMTKKMIYAE